jgi:hypothetical protein
MEVRFHSNASALVRPPAIKTEARRRVYWTNVLIDPKVSVGVFFTGCTGQLSLQEVHQERSLSPAAIVNCTSMDAESKCAAVDMIV